MHTYTQVKIARTLTRTYKAKLASYITYNDVPFAIAIIRKIFMLLTFDHSFRRGELLRVVRGHAVSG